MRYQFTGCKRISARDYGRRFQRERFSDMGWNRSDRDRAQGPGKIRDREAGKSEYQYCDQSRRQDSWQYAGHLPQMLCASGRDRELSRSEINRWIEANDRRRSGKGRCRSSLERSRGPEVFEIAANKKSRLVFQRPPAVAGVGLAFGFALLRTVIVASLGAG